MYSIRVPSGETTDKLPHKEKLLRKRNGVNDAHMLDEDTGNCRKQNNAVFNSKLSPPTFPGTNMLLTRKC